MNRPGLRAGPIEKELKTHTSRTFLLTKQPMKPTVHRRTQKGSTYCSDDVLEVMKPFNSDGLQEVEDEVVPEEEKQE